MEGVPGLKEWPTAAELRSLLKTRVGRPVSTQDIEDDVRTLLSTGGAPLPPLLPLPLIPAGGCCPAACVDIRAATAERSWSRQARSECRQTPAQLDSAVRHACELLVWELPCVAEGSAGRQEGQTAAEVAGQLRWQLRWQQQQEQQQWWWQ
jgi:hypothetical protein